MKIIHTSDWHVTEGARFAETRGCLDFIMDRGRTAGAQLWLVTGDLAGRRVPYVASAEERLLLCETFQTMAETAPVVIVRGNHDDETDLEVYSRLRGRWPIMVVSRPEVLSIRCPASPRGFLECRLFGLPYPSKRYLVGAGEGGALADQKVALETELRALLTAWRLQIRAAHADGVPAIVAAHLNVAGSLVGGGEVMIGREVELSPHELDELGADYIALGHIHRSQQMAQRAWYAGSPSAQDFGEVSDVKGFLTVDVVSGSEPVVQFRDTPARRLMQVAITVDRIEDAGAALSPDACGDLTGAEVKVRLCIREEISALVKDEAFVAFAEQHGAVRVIVERTVIPRTRSRLDAVPITETVLDNGQEKQGTIPASEAWASASDPATKVRIYWQALGDRAPAAEVQGRCLERFRALRTGA